MSESAAVPSPPAPEPPVACRPQDLGAFELTGRDGWARLGKLHTRHGILQTPALLPVVNPNLRTIEPRRMWDTFGVRGLMTNSYVIHKHDHLREQALAEGVHALLDYPGVVMTDSGTFQSYVYGDVEMGVEQIVAFQRAMGVDIATMLDVFGKPDDPREVLVDAVEVTAARGAVSLAAAKGTAFRGFEADGVRLRWEAEGSEDGWGEALFPAERMAERMGVTGEFGPMLLNGPVQGGPYPDLRRASAQEMGAQAFDVHPVGGIVPVMEQQRYREWLMMVVAAKLGLPAGRPVHLFGCGHPMLFALGVALGADLFDSAAYALFARDDRLLSVAGTVRLGEVEHWPVHSPALAGWTPAQVRGRGKEARMTLLAEHNLWVSLAEVERCREAVRQRRIWELVEQRSRAHPALREAVSWLADQGFETEDDPAWLPVDAAEGTRERLSLRSEVRRRMDAASTPLRNGGHLWNGSETLTRPYVRQAQRLLEARWRPWPDTDGGQVVILWGARPPFRRRLGTMVQRCLLQAPKATILIDTPFGLLPWTLHDVDPWAHLEAPRRLWEVPNSPDRLRRMVTTLGLKDREVHVLHAEMGGPTEDLGNPLLPTGDLAVLADRLDRLTVRDRLAVVSGADPETTWSRLADASLVRNREGRVKNVHDAAGGHLVSPRLLDGGISLADEGARWLAGLRPGPLPTEHEDEDRAPGFDGVAAVVVSEDAVPFVADGKSVFCGFTTAADGWLAPGLPCLVHGPDGALLAHGVAQHTSSELSTFRKGMAVKVRGALVSD